MSKSELHHPSEEARLHALRALQVLETPIEERFERITRLACRTFDVPVAAVSCIDLHRQWFKSIQGLAVSETERCVSFCQHTILRSDPLVVRDARTDERFRDNPLVTQDPSIVFYAGVPVFSEHNLPIASLCLIDTRPRELSAQDSALLGDFAKMVERELLTAAPNRIEHQLVEQIGESWRVALVDPLTRLWNHEGITTLLAESLAQAADKRSGLCAAMIDLRAFSQINAKLGHVAGDGILREIARGLLRRVDEQDVLGRVLGDSFLLLMNPARRRHEITDTLGRIQSFMDSFPLNGLEPQASLGATIAAVETAPGWAGPIEPLLEALEEAMFSAKKNRDAGPLIMPFEGQPQPASDQHAA